MSTPKKNTPLRPDGIPALEIYESVPMDNKTQNDCLVLDKHGQWFRFPSASHVTIVSDGIAFKWTGFDHWADHRTAAECAADHLELFGCELPKPLARLSKEDDYVHLKLLVWKARCMRAADRMEKPVAVDRKTGQPRVKKLAGRKYQLIKDDWSAMTIPQAMACLRILKDTIGELTVKVDGMIGECTEDDLKAAITTRQAELHTKQDPWRIFQYYRPRMIEAGIIRLV